MYCDNCGEQRDERAMRHYERLPVDIASAKAGESGSVCTTCAYTVVGPEPFHDEHLPYVRPEHYDELCYTVVCPCGWFTEANDVSWAYEVMFRHVLTDGGGD